MVMAVSYSKHDLVGNCVKLVESAKTLQSMRPDRHLGFDMGYGKLGWTGSNLYIAVRAARPSHHVHLCS